MNIAVENLPIIFLIIVGVGVAVIVGSVLVLAGGQRDLQEVPIKDQLEETASEIPSETASIEELFSYFLEQEEKKNEQLRQTVKQDALKKDGPKGGPYVEEKEMFGEIIKRYEQGEDVASIAKSLKKGIGEVRLILSLHAMR